MKRRVLSLLLALMLLVSALPLSALAEEQTKIQDLINPEHVSIVSDEGESLDAAGPEAPSYDITYHTSTSDAAKTVRKALKARKTSFTVGYRVAIGSWTPSGMDSLVKKIYDSAVKHNGTSDEGDYLGFHVYSFNWKTAAVDSQNSNYVYSTITLEAVYTSTASQEETVTSKVSSLLSSLNPTGTNYQKLKKVYDWICNNVTYNSSATKSSCSAYSAIVNKSANQIGYAALLYRLALEMDIECRIIASANDDHVWNIATTGNLFYNMDAAKDAYNNERTRFLVSNANYDGPARASEYNTTSFNETYPMGKYNYNPNTAATIKTQPKSVGVAKGETAKVTVKATGNGLTYKWYYKDADASKYSLTSSFTGNSYSVKMNADRAGRKVYCKITDQYGNTVKTNTVTLNMATPLKITTQPKNVTVMKGETAKVTLKATGDGLTYKWYYKNAGDSEYTYTSSFKSNSYSVEMTSARNGRRVLCKVYDKYGNMVQSESVVLKMAKPVYIKTQPVSVTVKKGETAKVSVVAVGDGLTYRWYYKDAGATKYTYTDSFTGSSYSVKMTADRNGRKLICKVYDKYGNMVQTDTVTIKMK